MWLGGIREERNQNKFAHNCLMVDKIVCLIHTFSDIGTALKAIRACTIEKFNKGAEVNLRWLTLICAWYLCLLQRLLYIAVLYS